MSARSVPHFTWTRLGVACCAGLVAFGIVDAVIPHGPPAPPAEPASGSELGRSVDGPAARRAVERDAAEQGAAAQLVAERFVEATDTTGPAHPDGDMATAALLAPGLIGLHPAPEPLSWSEDGHRTTVVLDTPGTPLAVGTREVTVMVTGRMTVTSSTVPATTVPVDERITLRQALDSHGSPSWTVTSVEAGS